MAMPKGFKFESWRYNRFRSPSDSGERFKIKYSAYYDKEGRLNLEEVGKEDIYDYIQSFADSCDLNLLMERVKATGDDSLISRVQGVYMDASELPDNWPAVMNAINKGREGFEKLPTDFKELYGNDFVQFVTNFDPSIFGDMGTVRPDPVVPDQVDTTEDVKEGE